MKPCRAVLVLLVSAMLLLTPGLALARAGGSYGGFGGGRFTSQGSFGARSFEFNGAQPLERSLAPRTSPYGGYGYGSRYGYGYHPFASGLAGGFFGSWLGSLLFPHWGMGYGWGFPGAVGSIFSWVVLLGLFWMAIRFFTGGFAGGGAMRTPYAAPLRPSALRYFGSGYGATLARGAPLAITGADYQAFEAILKQVQDAWSHGDLTALRPLVTPEMLSYFAEELAENQSRGVINHVEAVELLRGDLRQAWDEGRMHYATCYLHWRARDYTVRAGVAAGEPEPIVEGDPRHPSEAAEVWTFARTPGGQWLLSAIQQV